MITQQAGAISRAQLIDCGLRGPGIDDRVRRRLLFRVHRGVYALTPLPLSRRGQLFAALLALPAPGLLSESSAAWLWGVEPWREPISVTVRRECRSAPPGLRVLRRNVHTDDRARRNGLPLTSVPRTLIDLAPHGKRRLRHAFEEAARLSLIREPEMRAALDRATRRKGVQHVRALLDEMTAPARQESALESDFLALCRAHEIPAPLVNVGVAGWEVDAYWPDAGLAVEVDGFEFHGRDRFQFDRDRRKGVELAAAGVELIRLGQREIERGGETARVIRDRLEQAGARTPPTER